MTDKPHMGQFCWNELMTSDPNKAKEFYSSLFGWTIHEHDLGKMVYSMLKAGDKEIGGMMKIPSDQEKHIPPHWMSYVLVENVDAAVKKTQTLGGKILVPATPIADFGRFAVIQDPTGASIAVWEQKPCK